MKFHRIHTRAKCIDEDHNLLITLESFNNTTWTLYDEDRNFFFQFEANNFREANSKGEIIYFNWLLATKREPISKTKSLRK